MIACSISSRGTGSAENIRTVRRVSMSARNALARDAISDGG
jgi:hypothetical protein